MADIHEVMDARSNANRTITALETYGGQVEDGIHEDKAVALAICLGADAICARLLSLEMTLSYVGSNGR